MAEPTGLMESPAITIALTATSAPHLRLPTCLPINAWRLQPALTQIDAETMQMFESGTFDIARLEPWLRGLAVVAA